MYYFMMCSICALYTIKLCVIHFTMLDRMQVYVADHAAVHLLLRLPLNMGIARKETNNSSRAFGRGPRGLESPREGLWKGGLGNSSPRGGLAILSPVAFPINSVLRS